jgi:WD40 repeat protein/tRNA A-37 threonylcarbamoyl transferase component Bud32
MLLNDHMIGPARDRLEEAILCYLKASDDDCPLAPEHLVGRYPELASELKNFFADQDRLDPLLAPLRTSTRPAGVYPRAFGKYELLEEIGRGGMGVVYKARQRGLDRLVALKMIRVGALASKAELRRFRNEAESIAHLDHPHIVPIHDVGEHDGQMFFTMPLLASPLNDNLARFQNNPHEAARLVASIARALHHAHQRGILHRDLKPSNVLLDDAGRSFIADFGLAKRLDVETTLTDSGAILGTPGYLAPEQAAGNSRAVTTSSDVYSLGAILYTLLTGKPPLAGRTVLQTLALVRERDPEPPSRFNPRVDRDLEAVCIKCLEKEPARRYGSAEALAEDLERWQRGEPISARPPGRLGRAWRWCRRNPALATMAAVIALLVLFGISSLAAGFALVNRQRQIAVLHREIAEETAVLLRGQLYVANVSLGFGLLERLEIGELAKLLNETSSDRIGDRFEWNYLRQAAGTGLRELVTYRSHTHALYDMTWSPDFRHIASTGADRTIHIWDAATGKTIQVLGRNPATESLLVRGQPGDENCVRFSPDGKQLATACEDGTVRLWDLERGTWAPLLPAFQREVLTLDISPDGRLIAAAGTDGCIRVWNRSDHLLYAEFPGHSAVISGLAFFPVGPFLASSDHEHFIDVWNITERKQVHSFRTTDRVNAVAVSPDGTLLATGEANGLVRIWNVKTGHAITAGAQHIGHIRDVDFSHDGQRLASAGNDGCVRIWSVSDGILQTQFRAHPSPVWRAKFGRDDRRVITCGTDKTARIFALGPTARAVHWSPSRSVPVAHLAFAPSGKRLAMTINDNRLLVGDPRSEAALEILPPSVAPNGWLSFSPDGRRLAFVDPEGDVRFWLPEERRVASSVLRHAPPRDWRLERWRWWRNETRPEFLTESQLAILYGDGCLTHWDGDRASEREMRSARSYGPRSQLAISPDKTTMAVNDTEYSVILLGTAAVGTTLTRIPNVLFASALAFSPDGEELAIGCHNGLIRLVNVANGEDRVRLSGHFLDVVALAFSSDGLTLASAGTDGSARLWDVQTGRDLTILERRSGPLVSLAFSSDGRILAVAGTPHDDRTTVSIFDAGPSFVPASAVHDPEPAPSRKTSLARDPPGG